MDASAPRRAWDRLCHLDPLRLVGVEVRLVGLRHARPVRTAAGVHASRPVTLVRVVVDGAAGEVEGWGECAALADATYDREDAAGAFQALSNVLGPALVARARELGRLPAPSEIDGDGLPASGPLALAALEMAVADAHLRAGARSLAEVLSVPVRRVPVGAVVGRPGSVDELVGEVEALVMSGCQRVKVKIGPGWDLDPLDAVRDAHPSLLLSADANGAYGRDDIEWLAALDRFELACLEQPLPAADLEGHVLLARHVATPVCLDESLDSAGRALTAVLSGACSVVCLKPARLGGIGAALRAYRDCAGAGAGMWIGGMFESGLARSVVTTLAALSGLMMPGDVVPAHHYLEEDLVAPPAEGRDDEGRRWVAVHEGPGVAPAPDPGVLRRLGDDRTWIAS